MTDTLIKSVEYEQGFYDKSGRAEVGKENVYKIVYSEPGNDGNIEYCDIFRDGMLVVERIFGLSAIERFRKDGGCNE